MTIIWNHDLSQCPSGDRVFLLLRHGEKGNGELAVGMLVYGDNLTLDCYWTWGGPNSGSDIKEVPVAWATLPVDWFKALDVS